jgi:signal peptidase II
LTTERARIYDAWALVVVVLVIGLDQWTKVWVVENLSPPDIGPTKSLVGDYLTLHYIRNSGAAFGLFANSLILIVLIVVAIAVVSYLYLRMWNSGSLAYKLVFAMIIGGALGNLVDRARHSGYVVDFIFFRIPQIGFKFAIFNIADASISVGVFLLLLLVLFGGLHHSGTVSSEQKDRGDNGTGAGTAPPARHSGTLRSTE